MYLNPLSAQMPRAGGDSGRQCRINDVTGSLREIYLAVRAVLFTTCLYEIPGTEIPMAMTFTSRANTTMSPCPFSMTTN